MNVKHLRAKYQIEQYPVVFTFPEQVLYKPTVQVEVVSGVDPSPEAFAGLPFVVGNLVSVVVAGGVPGTIYRITCVAVILGEIVEISGTVAVKPTHAQDPDVFPVAPFTEISTTPPYPITTSSKAGLSVEFTSGEIRTVVRDAIAQETEANLFIAFTGGALKPPVVDAFAEQTETNLSIAFVGGMLKAPIVDAEAEATESNLHIAFKDSEIKTVLLNAKTQTTESNLEISFTGGSLYVP